MTNYFKAIIMLVALMLISCGMVAQDTLEISYDTTSLRSQDTLKFSYDTTSRQLTIEANFFFGFRDTDTICNKTIQSIIKQRVFTHGMIVEEHRAEPHIFISRDLVVTVDCDYFDMEEIKRIHFFKEKWCNLTNDTVEEIVVEIVGEQTESEFGNGLGTGGENDFGPLLLVILLLVIIAGGGLFMYSRRKRSLSATTSMEIPQNTIEIIKSNTPDWSVGLDHVRAHSEEYYRLDMQQQYSDTAVHQVFLHHTVVKKTYDFFKTFLASDERTPETGCFFIGCWEYDDENHKTYNISLEDIVEPGDDMVPDEYSFDFGHKIGWNLDVMIRNMREKTGREYVHTVWMHSHPGIGLFLSMQDLVAHDLLKSRNEAGRLAAFVIDTNSPHWDFSVFTARLDGEMNTQTDKTYSLDELYSWCRRVHAQVEDKNHEDYLKIDLNDKNDGLSNLYISGKVINRIEEAVYDAGKGSEVAGYLSGDINLNEGWCRIDNCTSTSNASSGTLIVDDETPYENLFVTYKDTLHECLVLIVYRSDEEIWISTRKDCNDQFGKKTEITVCTMGQMREWIRRKRNYK